MSKKGLIVLEGDSWAAKVGPDLGNAFEDRGWDTESAAHAGDTAHEMAWSDTVWLTLDGIAPEPDVHKGTQPEHLLFILKRIAARGRKPAAIVLSLGGNDLIHFVPFVLRDGEDTLLDRVHAKTLWAWIDGVLRRDIEHVILTTEKHSREAFGEAVPIVLHTYTYPDDNAGGLLLGLIGPWLDPVFKAYHYPKGDPRRGRIVTQLANALAEAIARAAASTGALCVDLRPVLTHADLGDEVHPTKEGFAKAAAAIEKAFWPAQGRGRRETLLALLALPFLSSCDPEVTGPTPVPTPPPDPIPTPAPFSPLRIEGNQFKPHLRGIAWCCADASAHGWPLVNQLAIQKTVDLGGNWTTMRLGPHPSFGEVGAPVSIHGVSISDVNQVSAYLPVAGGKVDLTRWNEQFWQRVTDALAYAQAAGVYVEVDVMDGWALRTRTSAWETKRNIQGYDGAGCGATRRPLDELKKAWVREVAARTRNFPNVLYQISNEDFICQPSQGWEGEIADLLRAFAPGHLIGSNAQAPWSAAIADYVTEHSLIAARPGAVPALVNESHNSQTVAEFCSAYRVAESVGTYYMLWRGWKTEAEVAAAARCWQ